VDEEDQGASGGDPDDGWKDEIEPDGLRGWISPDDRLWRHPSESAASFAGQPATPGEKLVAADRAHTGPWVIGGATVFIVVALVTAGLVMVTTDTGQQYGANVTAGTVSLIGAPTTDPGMGRLSGSKTVASMVAAIRPSTVALIIDGTHGEVRTTGLVAESGGIIVTTSRSLSGALSITAIEPDGSRHTAELVGVDPTSGLGVVRIDDDLPAATFDSDDLSVGQVAVAAALTPGRKADAAPSSTVYAGTVLSTGQALGADAITTDFSATAIEAPLSDDDLGCPLIDDSGQVSGMLETTKGNGTSTMAVFLPAELVLGVARQIVSSGTVDHGWLGVQASDAEPTTTTNSSGAVVTSASATYGARLDSIDNDSPAADAGLAPGDVITGIDGQQVHSTAELRTRLYPDPPGTDLAITFDRAGTTLTATVTLADAGSDAPGDDSSP
jgi:putative serine protease PepD